MAVDLLRNRNPAATLGPFDGKVAALAHIAAEHYFITTNADYVPDFLSQAPSRSFPPVGHAQWTARYCHLPVIAKKGTRPDLDVMWWDPSPADFRIYAGHQRARNKVQRPSADVRNSHLSPFRRTRSKHPHVAEQLRTLPTTYDKMVFGVTSLQRGCLELDALYNYMTIYKPRVDNFMTALPGMIPVARTVGAFTTVPAVAQQLWSAACQNILAVVPLQQPNFVVADTPGAAAPPVLYSGNQTLDKIAAIHRAAIETPWYRDPFETNTSPAPPAPAPPAPRPTASIPIASSPVASSSHGVARAKKQPSRLSRAKPCISRESTSEGTPKDSADKFTTVTLEEMAPSIVAWADALAQVDQSIPPLTSDPVDRQYVLPEPALFVTTSSERRRKFLHHWNLLSDGFIYRLSQPGHSQPLSAQEWRDILEGLITKRGNPNSKTYRRSEKIEDRIRPALKRRAYGSVEGRQGLLRGHTLLGVPLEMSKRGWASTAVEEAPLLCREDSNSHAGLENADASSNNHRRHRSSLSMVPVRYATFGKRAFWEYFGRAAVVPLRLDHELKKEDGQTPKLAPDGHPTTERARLHVSQASGLDSMSASPDFHVEQAMYSTFGGARRMPDDSRTASSPTLTMDGHTERARLHVAQPTYLF
ncbi:hypothetical protein B0H10DRAFT_1955659 [Mycena sp. CBHHK59/15]|nr:hypothetical protein B0H10DRAFT_1955659 [Mycena sp. CBHHK59/15]